MPPARGATAAVTAGEPVGVHTCVHIDDRESQVARLAAAHGDLIDVLSTVVRRLLDDRPPPRLPPPLVGDLLRLVAGSVGGLP